MDKNGDGKVTPEEFEAAGFKGLPSFDDIGAEGHHYDVESGASFEIRVHLRRKRSRAGFGNRVLPSPRRYVPWRGSTVCHGYPSPLQLTPSPCSIVEQFHSTPETQTDESYNHPEDIEHFSHHENIEQLEAEREAKFQGITVEEALRSHDEPAAKPESASRPKITRGVPKQDPTVKYKDIEKDQENQSEWGTGEQGYKQPKSPVEKMRSVLLSGPARRVLIVYLVPQKKSPIQGTRIYSG